MPSIINADNGIASGSVGLKYSSDNSGVLALQSNNNTLVAISNTNVSMTTNTSATTITATNGLLLNSNTINTSYTIPDGYNAGSFGPVSVANNATVTVSNTAVWTIV